MCKVSHGVGSHAELVAVDSDRGALFNRTEAERAVRTLVFKIGVKGDNEGRLLTVALSVMPIRRRYKDTRLVYNLAFGEVLLGDKDLFRRLTWLRWAVLHRDIHFP